mmetsp:Transcript_17360/g.23993  ORF Transcript_17360/g.23993 Transcript_17360/m.23993 type:complete len:561 (-) Transcript_17360:169-1851(-)
MESEPETDSDSALDELLPGADVEASVTSHASDETSTIREDMVQNAIGFLNHVQVRNSSDLQKRKFLVDKGLTDAEINEAYSRVSAAPATSLPHSRQPPPKPFENKTTNQNTSIGTSLHSQPTSSTQLHGNPTTSTGMPWTQMVLIAGAIGAGSWVAKDTVKGLMKRAVISCYPEQFSQKLPEALEIRSDKEAQKFMDSTTAAMEAQTKEMKNVTDAIASLVKTFQEQSAANQLAIQTATSSNIKEIREELQLLSSKLDQPSREDSGMKIGLDSSSDMHTHLLEIRSMLTRTLQGGDVHQYAAPTPIAGLTGLNRNIEGWGTTPPATPACEPEVPLSPTGSMPIQGLSPAEQEIALDFKETESKSTEPDGRVRGPGGQPPQDMPPHPRSYAEVLEMLEQGQTPPGIREIDDKPPNPHQAFPSARLQPKPKPWEKKEVSTPTRRNNALSGEAKTGAIPPWAIGQSGAPGNIGTSVTSQSSVTGSSSMIRELNSSDFDIKPNESNDWSPPPKPSFSLPKASSTPSGKLSTPVGHKIQSSTTKNNNSSLTKRDTFSRDSSSEDD